MDATSLELKHRELVDTLRQFKERKEGSIEADLPAAHALDEQRIALCEQLVGFTKEVAHRLFATGLPDGAEQANKLLDASLALVELLDRFIVVPLRR